jgi:hypothetical protein
LMKYGFILVYEYITGGIVIILGSLYIYMIISHYNSLL